MHLKFKKPQIFECTISKNVIDKSSGLLASVGNKEAKLLGNQFIAINDKIYHDKFNAI